MIRIEGQVKEFSLHEDLFHNLLSFFRQDSNFFLIAAECLILYNELDEFTEELFDQSKEGYIRQYPSIQERDYDAFFSALSDIYQMDDATFRKLRGDLTEYVITHTGPAEQHFKHANYMHDVFVKKGENYIGIEDEPSRGKNLDVCFYEKEEFDIQEHVQCELYECKIDLKTFIPTRRIHRPSNVKKVEKIKFMQAIEERFEHNPNFSIGFATFTKNLSRELSVLRSLQCNQLSILSREDIYQMLQRR